MELDYFRKRRPLFRWLRYACWGALALSVAWVAWAVWPANHEVFQAGPLTPAHAMFNHDCQKCHTTSMQPLARLWLGDKGVHSVADQTCVLCHAGPDHQHRSDLMIAAENCASCHKEHRGKMSLARVADGDCTICHASLQQQYAGKTKFRDVHYFATHPEFALALHPHDPGTVKFNHERHLNLTEIKGKEVPGLKAQLKLLRQQQCNYCHQTDATGRYMQPISYDNHCKSCHPLQIGIVERKGTAIADMLKPAAAQFAGTPVSHPRQGETSADVRASLHQRYLSFVQNHTGVMMPAIQESPRPLPASRRGEPVSEKQLDWVNRQMNTAERMLFDGADGCRRCHTENSQPPMRKNGLPEFIKPHIPRRWYSHSVFNHQKHQMLQCTACHDKATTSTTNADVLMPRIGTCQQCHNAGGARFDCVECHNFHQRELRGKWQGQLTIGDCTR